MNYNYAYQMPMRPGMYPQAGDDRLFFPFLTGALVGGAAVGLTRPRPIYNVGPQGGYGYGPGPYYQPGAPFYNNSYSYYVPYRPY